MLTMTQLQGIIDAHENRFCRMCGAEAGRPHHDDTVSDGGRLTVEIDDKGRCQPCAEGVAALKQRTEPEPCESCGGRGWVWPADSLGVQACDCGKYYTEGGVADDDAAGEALEAYVQELEALVRTHGPEGYPERLYRARLGFRWVKEPPHEDGIASGFETRERYVEEVTA